MKTLVVANLKGGVGKSLLALHVAVGSKRGFEKVCVLDCDQQLTALDWYERRRKVQEEPEVRYVLAHRMEGEHARCREDGVGLVVVDTPANNSEVLIHACGFADMVLVPVRPAVPDLASLARTVKLLGENRKRRKPVYLVVNGARPVGRDAENAEQVAAEVFGLSVLPARLVDRVAYFRSLTKGLTVFETEPKSRAAAEMEFFVSAVGEVLRSGAAGEER